MAYKPISDYGVIGDMHTAALVARDGSIDWMCLPDFDSPWLFGALLDDERGGYFSIRAVETEQRRQHYYPDSNVRTGKGRCYRPLIQRRSFDHKLSG